MKKEKEVCFECMTYGEIGDCKCLPKVNKVGRPKVENPKKQITLRLSIEVVDKVKSQPNQTEYIERLVNMDISLNKYNMQKIKTPKEIVIKYYPNAKAINIGCKNGDYYNIYSGEDYLGQGKTLNNAWKAAYNNNCRF